MTLMPNTVVAGGAASDVQVVPGMVVFGSAGGRGNEGRLQVDGLSVGSAFNGAGVSSYIPDVGNAQEIAMTTSGGLGEAEVGGPALNIVPKTGGNSIKGSFYASGVTKGHDRQQLHAGSEGPRPDDAGRQHEDLGLQPRGRRAGQERPDVVLRHAPRRRQSSDGAGNVREPERRRSDQVDVRGGSDPAGRRRAVVPPHLAAADHPGEHAQQVRAVLGRTVAV